MHVCVGPEIGPPPGPPGRRPPDKVLDKLAERYQRWVEDVMAVQEKHGNGWEVAFGLEAAKAKKPHKAGKKHAHEASTTRLIWVKPDRSGGHHDLRETLKKGLGHDHGGSISAD